MKTRRHHLALVALLSALFASSCGDGGSLITGDADAPDPGDEPTGRLTSCSIPGWQIHGAANKDGIPALTDPPAARHGGAGTEYLRDHDRVIGLIVDDEALAIPLNILWWHEIVNLDVGGLSLAVTHCPLTGSSMAFDRGPADDAEFGVSGLLYLNNLMMYDRNDPESLWPQMAAGARCGVRDGTSLPMYPILETRWDAWRQLNPGTRVVTSQTGYERNYEIYPYGSYDDPANERRPPKERVLGIPGPDGGGLAFPFAPSTPTTPPPRPPCTRTWPGATSWSSGTSTGKPPWPSSRSWTARTWRSRATCPGSSMTGPGARGP